MTSPAWTADYRVPRYAWHTNNFCPWDLGDSCYWHGQHIIHRKEDFIAYLEADPDVDDAFKGPIITHARAKIHWLRRAVGIRRIVWPGPCCYSRKPIYIR
jgi:hypothetical protein